MRRLTRLIFAASLLSLSALLPTGVLAAGTLTEYVVGAEYAVGTCPGGQTGSFAGAGSATLGGSANAVFNTTICNSGFTPARTALILPGGNFTLATSSLTLVGQYAGGTVGPGVVTPLYPGSRYFCKEKFPVVAALAPATTVPDGATNVGTGSAAVGVLTHIGVYTPVGECRAFAAAIAGQATLIY
jgi:hypothetical protein